MANPRHLANAPITEALVDFRVSLPLDFDPSVFERVRDELRSEYPQVDVRRGYATSFGVKEGVPMQPNTEDIGIHGFFLKSEDGLDLAQFRRDGFTLNRMKPYTSWEAVRPEALRLWELYVQAAAPRQVERLALRFINHVPLPGPLTDLSKYLTAPPTVAPDVPQEVSSFLTRMVLQESTVELSANVLQAFEGSLKHDTVTIILDIDAYKNGPFGIESDDVGPTLDLLRDFKNRIFFGSVTESTLELFE